MKTFLSCLSLAICAVILTYCIGCFYAYFYPIKFQDEIIFYSDKYGLKSSLVASVINVESGYKENSVSNKGAVGLMQLMPSTAEWVADKNGIVYEKDKLLEAGYNIDLGCCYLSYLIKIFDSQENGVCAYNAGLGNVQNWLKNKEYSEDGKKLKEIPFKETKDYLQRVYKNYHYYKNRYK